MTLLRDLSTSWSGCFTLVIFLILFESRYSWKSTVMLSSALMVPLLLINFVLLFLLGPETMSTLLLLTCSIPSLIFFWFLAKNRDGRFLFTFCMVDTLILEILHWTSILDFFLGNSYIFTFISRLILYPLLALVTFKWIRPTYLSVQQNVRSGWFTFSAISLIFYVLLSVSFGYPTMITARLEYLPVHILLLILMPILYIHIFNTLRHQQQSHEIAAQDQILQLQVTNLKSRIEEFSVSDDLFRMERHNFRHKMQTIAELVERREYDELHALVQEYSTAVQKTQVRRYCQHTILDAVISSYFRRAAMMGIQTLAKIDVPNTLPVPESELATVIANALENAIQACEKMPPDRRILEIKALSSPCLMFQIRNSHENTVVFDKNGLPVSPFWEHGYGTRTIVSFCKKHGAYYEFKADKDYFTLRISL